MLRAAEYLGGRAGLDEPPAVHHRDPIGDVGDDAHIVRDEHHAEPVLPAERADELQDLGLDGDVEGSRGLVGDQQFGIGAQRQRDHHPLAHSSGELVRVVPEPSLRLVDADLVEKAHGPLRRLRLRETEMGSNRLDELSPYGVQRIERGQRILEDHPDCRPTQLLPLRLGQGAEIALVQPHSPARHLPGRLEQAQDGVADGRLPGSGFAHDPEDLAGLDLERHAFHRNDGAAAARELDAQILDGKQGHRTGPLSPAAARRRPVPLGAPSRIRKSDSDFGVRSGADSHGSGTPNAAWG